MPDNIPAGRTTDPEADGFDPEWYLATYPDVAAAGMDPWDHYSRFGKAEGRMPQALTGAGYARDLWDPDHADAGRAALETQAAEATGSNRDMACWWLARWHATQGHWAQAHDLCARVMIPDNPLPMRPGIGLALLAAQAAHHTGDTGRAHALLDAADRTWPTPGEVALLRSMLDQTGPAALNRVWDRAGLGQMRLAAGQPAPLDRLYPRRRPIADLISRRWRGTAPLVSVVMPMFNAADTLTTAITSLQRQHWSALDIIIVDDGSTDHSGDLAGAAAREDPRIRVLTLTGNQGAYVARNAGVAEARGDFITVMDADDWAHPAKIRAQVTPLIADPACKGSLSHWVRCDAELTFGNWRMAAGGLIHRNVSSLMIRRGVLDQLGYWDRVRVGADTEYYYRLIAVFGGAALTEVLPGVPLSLGRTGTGSLTGQAQTHQRTDVVGVRADYQAATARWHARGLAAGHTGDRHPLYLHARPPHRPFDAPAALTLPEDPPAPLQPEDRIRNCDMFDTAWYLDVNTDVRHAGKDAALHYLQSGAAQGRDPSPRFSTSGYRLAHLDDTPDANPLLHWLEHDRVGALSPLPRFAGTDQDHTDAYVDTLVFGHQAGTHVFGAERSLLDMLDQMRAQGQRTLVVLPHIHNRAYLDELLARSAGVQIIPYRWRHRTRAPHPDTAKALDTLIADISPRKIYINTLVLDAPAQAARRAGVPLTVHMRERPDQDAMLCANMGCTADELRRWLLEEADDFVVTSTGVADWIAAPNRTTVVPNKVDRALFDLAPPDFAAPVRVALISSNIAKKGISDFVEMAEHLHAMNIDARCLLIGPPSADLTALGALPATVSAPGYTTDPLAAIGSTDIVVSLSHFAESFGRTVLEAMAAGRPVVCYARGHLMEMVEDGVTGFLVPPDDPKAAAEAVGRLIRDPALMAHMGAQGRVYARRVNGLPLRPAGQS